MNGKFVWFLSASLLTLTLWLVGLVGMVAKSLEFLFEDENRAAVAEQGGEWIMIAALGLGFVLLAVSFISFLKDNRRLGIAFHDMAVQSMAILGGGLFAWTLVGEPGLLVMWALFYAFVHLKLHKEGWYESQRRWRHWTLHALTASTAGFVLAIGYL